MVITLFQVAVVVIAYAKWIMYKVVNWELGKGKWKKENINQSECQMSIKLCIIKNKYVQAKRYVTLSLQICVYSLCSWTKKKELLDESRFSAP